MDLLNNGSATEAAFEASMRAIGEHLQISMAPVLRTWAQQKLLVQMMLLPGNKASRASSDGEPGKVVYLLSG